MTLDRGNPQSSGAGTNLGPGRSFGPGTNLRPGGNGLDTPATTAPLPAAAVAALLSQAFLWMFAGLLLTAVVAFAVQGNETLRRLAADYFIVLVFGQLGMVLAISAGIRRFGATAALGLFFVYAATLGLTVGLIVSLYTGESVATAFLSAGAMFGGAALFGATTKRSLAGLGGTLTMGLFGLIVASIVNLFLGSSPLGWVISVAGVVLFTVLTAYDVKRISSGAFVAATGSIEKAAVLGALHLYLDFVNLFLFLLRLTGGRR